MSRAMASAEPMIPAALAPPQVEPEMRRSFSSSRMPLADSISSLPSVASPSGLRAKLGLGGVARRTLGIVFLLVTVCLWTVSNFLASYIFSDHTYDKPFFVVYINTSMFALSLIPMFVQFILEHGLAGVRAEALDLWHNTSCRGGRSGMRPLKTTDDEEDAGAGERLLGGEEMESSGTLEFLDPADAEKEDKLNLRETAWLSLEFCMIWFCANYFASACLGYTSVASVTILTSTSSVWTLILCAVMGVEGFTWRKLIGVLASLAGVSLISAVDLSGKSDEDRGSFPHKSQGQIAIGDSMALFSAIVYGLYVTVMKRRVDNEDRVNMQLFFGLVGLFNVVFLWPGFFVLHYTGIEPFEMPPTGKVWAIVMLNSVSSFVSDMSWAYAMLLTTPLVVTVGLSLTIPLSLIGEMIQYAQYSSWLYWVGAGIVLLSFLFVNHESAEGGGDEHHTGEVRSREPGVP